MQVFCVFENGLFCLVFSGTKKEGTAHRFRGRLAEICGVLVEISGVGCYKQRLKRRKSCLLFIWSFVGGGL